MSSDDVKKKEAKGWKQLRALDYINNFPEGGTFQELTALVAGRVETEGCFPETYTKEWIDEVVRSKHPEAGDNYIQYRAAGLREGKARHLVRYLYRFQDKPDPASGKGKTLREQGRIILPGKEVVIRESMSSVVEFNPEKGKNEVRSGMAKPKRAAAVKLPEDQKPKVPLTEDRLKMFRQANANVKTRNTASEIAKLAQAGAHRFRGTMVKNTAPEIDTPESEAEEVG